MRTDTPITEELSAKLTRQRASDGEAYAAMKINAARLEIKVCAMVNALSSIAEYWNGSPDAAVDAAEEMRTRAETALAASCFDCEQDAQKDYFNPYHPMTAKAAQHTPGPWQVETNNRCRDTFVGPVMGGQRICEVFHHATSGNPHLANARLIAAAPELLAALQATTAECERYLKDIGDCDHSVGVCCCELKRTIETARAAIASATA